MLILYGKVDTHFTFFLQKQSRHSKELFFLLLTNQSRQCRDFILIAFSKAKQAKQIPIPTCLQHSKVEAYSYLYLQMQSRQSSHSFFTSLFLLVFKRLSRQSREFTSCFWQSKEGKVRINLIFFRKAKYLDKVENYFH